MALPKRLSVFGLLIMESARHMQDHWDVYQKVALGWALVQRKEKDGRFLQTMGAIRRDSPEFLVQ